MPIGSAAALTYLMSRMNAGMGVSISRALAEITDAVLKSGFKTTSKNFRTMVAIQLGKAKGIKRVSRGQYTAK